MRDLFLGNGSVEKAGRSHQRYHVFGATRGCLVWSNHNTRSEVRQHGHEEKMKVNLQN
jgi:hypothetical protein